MKKYFVLVFSISFLLSTYNYCQKTYNKMDVAKKGASIYGRVFYDSGPLGMGNVFVTDPDLKILYGESLTSIEMGSSYGSYSIDGLPANKKMKIFVFHKANPGWVGLQEITLSNNEKRNVTLLFDRNFEDPGFLAEGLPSNMNITNAGAASAVLLVSNLVRLLVTLISQESKLDNSLDIVSQLNSLKNESSISNKGKQSDNSSSSETDVSFEEFVKKFFNDEQFQRNRIVFPLTWQMHDGMTVDQIYNRSDWRYLNSPIEKIQRQKIKYLENRYVLFVFGTCRYKIEEDSPYNQEQILEYNFIKNGNSYYLIKVDDRSYYYQ
jgi:hypothetical protein